MSTKDIYEPSHEELEKRCAEVQATWSPAMRQRRKAYSGCNEGWEVPWVVSDVGKDSPRGDLEQDEDNWWENRDE